MKFWRSYLAKIISYDVTRILFSNQNILLSNFYCVICIETDNIIGDDELSTSTETFGNAESLKSRL